MVDADELRALTRWCGDHGLEWRPAISTRGEPAILLQVKIGRVAWSDMMVVAAGDDLALLDGCDLVIAIGSHVMALLDAFDASLPCDLAMLDISAYGARSSEPVWNRSGSASTYPSRRTDRIVRSGQPSSDSLRRSFIIS